MIHLLPPDGGDHLSFIGHSFFAKKSARLGPRIIRDGFQTNRTYTGGRGFVACQRRATMGRGVVNMDD